MNEQQANSGKSPVPDSAIRNPPSAIPNRSWRLPREGFYWLWTAVLVIAVGLFKSINLLTLLGYVLLAIFALNGLVAGRRLRSLQVRRRIGEPVFAQTP